MKTISLRTLVREPLKVKRMIAGGMPTRIYHASHGDRGLAPGDQ